MWCSEWLIKLWLKNKFQIWKFQKQSENRNFPKISFFFCFPDYCCCSQTCHFVTSGNDEKMLFKFQNKDNNSFVVCELLPEPHLHHPLSPLFGAVLPLLISFISKMTNTINHNYTQTVIVKMHAGILSITSLVISPVCSLHTQNKISMHLGQSKGLNFLRG